MDGFITIGTKLDTKQFDKQIEIMEQKAAELEQQLEDPKSIGLSSRQVDEINVELEKTKNKIIQLRREKAKLEQPQGLKQLKEGVDNFGTGLQNAAKKASRLIMGIFGIRTAFMLMRRASSELAGYDDQYAANLEYIRYALVQAIAPVLQRVVELAMKLLSYINAIAVAWFRVNLFENASVDNFAQMKKGVGGVTNAVKELKKQLAGFDEMNVLQDNGSITSGGGGGGITLPSMDLSSITDVEIPGWLQWIMDHKNEVLGLLTAIGALIAGIKIAAFVKGLTGAEGAFIGLSSQMKNFLAGAGLVAGGIALMITASHNLIANWDEMSGAERMVQAGLVALGAVMTAFGLTMMGVSGPWAAVIALIAALGTLAIVEHTEKNNILSLKKAEEDLAEAKRNTTKAYNEYVNAVDRAEEAEKELDDAQRNTGISAQRLVELVERGQLDYKNMTEQQREVYKAYLNNKDAQEKLAETTDEVTEANKREMIAEWERMRVIAMNANEHERFRDTVVEAWRTGALETEEAQDLIEKSMKGMTAQAQSTFMEDLPSQIKRGLDPTQYQSFLDRLNNFFTGGWDNMLFTLQDRFNTFKKTIELQSFVLTHPELWGSYNKWIWHQAFGNAKGAVVYHDAPKLAVGGIINQPGRGIPIGRAIGGERGAEGVIPLTDSQQMEILGESIGRYITINASIPVSMNGRLISRELKQVQADQDFAYNM